MKEIEIKPGVRVKKSDISFTEDLPGGLTRVSTLNASWDCDFPASVIWDLVNLENIENRIAFNPQPEVKKPFDGMWGKQYWVG